MDIRRLTADGVTRHRVDELPELLAADDALLWVDVPEGDPDAVAVLGDVFGFHPMAVQDSVHRSPVP